VEIRSLGLRGFRPALLLGAVVLAVLHGAATAHAQQPTAPARGELRVLVFVDQAPAAGVTVEVPEAIAARTNSDGAAVLVLPEGEHSLRLSVPRHVLPAARPGNQPVIAVTEPIQVVGGEQVEAIVTLDASGRLEGVDVESAASRAEERRKAAEFAEKQANLPRGIVRGRVFTGPDRAPIAGARVFVRGAPVETGTDEDGAFQLELAEGEYDLVVIHAQYATANLERVKVDPNRPNELRIALEKATPQLEDFVVTAPHIEGGVAALVAERRQSSSVDDVIGAEEMSRSGDSDAAGALKRVTGITVVGGQFVYVRGMGERYSTTLLNGQAIPSPEPERRVIPLDLFSTDVLESVVIQKSPSPDTPAEFGGGVVQLRTRALPEEFIASVELSTGMVTTSTFRDRPTYDGGDLDFLGTDDGTRELPSEIREGSPLVEGNRFQDGFSKDELAEMARLLPDTYNVHEEQVPLDTGLTFTLGDKRALFGVPVGFLLSGAWGNDHAYRDEMFKRFVPSGAGGLSVNNDFEIEQQTQTVGASGIAVVGAEPARGHEIKATTLLLRVSDNETAVVTGRSSDLGTDIRQSRLQFVERQLLTQQVAGEHELARLRKAKLEWRYAFSRANRDEPDRREYYYADATNGRAGDFQLSTRPAGNQRVWSDLIDRVHDLGLDYTQPLPLWSGLEAKVKVGGTLVSREREYDTIRLTLRAPTSLAAEVRRQPPEQIWTQANLNSDDGWILEDTTQATDAYTAEQTIQAGYAMATVPISERIEITAGARVERSRQRVETFGPFDAMPTPQVTELDDTDILPSATGKWQLTEELVLRGGYGRTVTRPDFRELSESGYRDVITATRYTGNPELVRGTIDNVDARIEYYFSSDELVSVGGFYKSFKSPIEQIDLGGVDRTISWSNADGADNYGVEFEGRRRLGFVADWLEDAFAAANVAVVHSRVTLGDQSGASTSKERALQGQSPYVVNLQLGYDDAAGSGLTAVLLYNVFGERIRDVGRFGTPDIFEQPYHQLDLVFSQKLGDHWQLKAKAQNLLDREVEFQQGDEVSRRYKVGRSFGLSLGWSY
jgi:outer membrane receptor protein involved in Fe transport